MTQGVCCTLAYQMSIQHKLAVRASQCSGFPLMERDNGVIGQNPLACFLNSALPLLLPLFHQRERGRHSSVRRQARREGDPLCRAASPQCILRRLPHSALQHFVKKVYGGGELVNLHLNLVEIRRGVGLYCKTTEQDFCVHIFYIIIMAQC